MFFYVVFESLYGCVNAVFDASKSSFSLFSWYICNVTPSPPHTLHPLEPFHFLAGDQLVVPRGVKHISCHYKNTIEGAGENRRTNEQTLGVNSRAKRGVMQHYISDSIYGLTLAMITSENSTKLLECRLICPQRGWTLSYAASPLCSGVYCRPPLSVFRRQLLSAPLSNKLSSRVPLPLPATLCLVSRQNRQRNRLLGGPPT